MATISLFIRDKRKMLSNIFSRQSSTNSFEEED